MKEYYFTFGSSHWNKDGIPMQNFWIRVIAEDYITARKVFIKRFSSLEMQAPDKWAFQYEAEDFEPGWFPSGEYLCLDQ